MASDVSKWNLIGGNSYIEDPIPRRITIDNQGNIPYENHPNSPAELPLLLGRPKRRSPKGTIPQGNCYGSRPQKEMGPRRLWIGDQNNRDYG
jgi:hypothetical protein